MITVLKGILLTKKEGSWTNPETNKTYNYKNIEIGVVDNNIGNIIKISCNQDINLNNYILHKDYNYKVDIPTQFNERSKIKLLEIMGEK